MEGVAFVRVEFPVISPVMFFVKVLLESVGGDVWVDCVAFCIISKKEEFLLQVIMPRRRYQRAQSPPDPPLKVNEMVNCLWKDGNLYEAKVISITKKKHAEEEEEDCEKQMPVDHRVENEIQRAEEMVAHRTELDNVSEEKCSAKKEEECSDCVPDQTPATNDDLCEGVWDNFGQSSSTNLYEGLGLWDLYHSIIEGGSKETISSDIEPSHGVNLHGEESKSDADYDCEVTEEKTSDPDWEENHDDENIGSDGEDPLCTSRDLVKSAAGDEEGVVTGGVRTKKSRKEIIEELRLINEELETMSSSDDVYDDGHDVDDDGRDVDDLGHDVDDDDDDQVNKHKTAAQFVCNLVMDSKLYQDMQGWYKTRKTLPGTHLFSDFEGKPLKSNYLANIMNKILGGPVREMRKVPYYMGRNTPGGLTDQQFLEMATHLSHKPSTAHAYYDVVAMAAHSV
ncbi:hypothetical protein CAPTEDRAFT_222570 [Capitella teleta]|uniref:Uncharacterized protein n=1 Tax=Capitella teleta TaxID=283909 RepID=R7TB62_CAPTE|nr:hypothetical protein CAPTEDRAFT_222570 [Capitella teleta]|eukprot:ELT90973.1 hypothetical protein CAPTEDRAFT_222570 [Capitella teleta]